MARESVEVKARRYLVEGRLVVTAVDVDRIAATCRGDGQLYRLGRGDGEDWWCECPARARCAHLVALGLVVATSANGNQE
jgi:uncharacterized Zn finger protein